MLIYAYIFDRLPTASDFADPAREIDLPLWFKVDNELEKTELRFAIGIGRRGHGRGDNARCRLLVNQSDRVVDLG